MIKTVQGATKPSEPDLLLGARPPPNPSPQTWLEPNFDLIRTRFGPAIPLLGPNQVEIGLKSGPNPPWGWGKGLEGVGAGGVGPTEVAEES